MWRGAVTTPGNGSFRSRYSVPPSSGGAAQVPEPMHPKSHGAPLTQLPIPSQVWGVTPSWAHCVLPDMQTPMQ